MQPHRYPLVVLLVLLAVPGCDRNADNEAERAARRAAEERAVAAERALAAQQVQPAARPSDTVPGEAEAKEKLKTVLDSWVFGDSKEKFEADHPGISFLHTEYLFDRPTLQKYDLAAGRKDPLVPDGVVGYEFPVVLTLQSRVGTEVKKQHIYSVRTPDGKSWSVYGDLKK